MLNNFSIKGAARKALVPYTATFHYLQEWGEEMSPGYGGPIQNRDLRGSVTGALAGAYYSMPIAKPPVQVMIEEVRAGASADEVARAFAAAAGQGDDFRRGLATFLDEVAHTPGLPSALHLAIHPEAETRLAGFVVHFDGYVTITYLGSALDGWAIAFGGFIHHHGNHADLNSLINKHLV